MDFSDLIWIIVFVVGAVILSLAYSIWKQLQRQYLPAMPIPEDYQLPEPGHVYTHQELAAYNGENGKPILIAVMGTVYDITSHPSGREFYGKNASYGLFAGKDASRALATMDFKEIDNTSLEGLSAEQESTLNEWKAKYDQKYKAVGTLADNDSSKKRQ